MYICVYMSIFIYMIVYTLLYLCAHIYFCARVGIWMYVCEFMCLAACYSILGSFTRSELGNRRFEFVPLWTRYTDDSKTDHEIIRRFVPIHAMKIIRRFGSKVASFHVSIYFCVIFLFTNVNRYLCFTCTISCDHLIYFTSMIMRIISWVISERPL